MKKRILSLVCLTLVLALALGSFALAADDTLAYHVKDYGVTVLMPSSLFVLSKDAALKSLSEEELAAYGGADSPLVPQAFFYNSDSTLKGTLIILPDTDDADFSKLKEAELETTTNKLTAAYSLLYTNPSVKTEYLRVSDLLLIHNSVTAALAAGGSVQQEQYSTVKNGLSITLTFTSPKGMVAGAAELARQTALGLRVCDSGFVDMCGHWADQSVAKAVELGLFKGTSATTFSPDRTISRAELVTTLYRLYESKTGKQDDAKACSVVFTDVACDSWYLSAVNWAAKNGIVKGSGGKFRPNDPVSREEFASILYRCDCFMTGTQPASGAAKINSSAKDAAQVSAWAVGAMNWALGKKLLTGTSAGLLAPQSSATRAQAAAILARYAQ
jgi:hypothetical protein